jgi:Xaa-Pro aminopeptidase
MATIPDGVRFSGRSEAQVARDLAELTVAEGHDEAAFTIVASGPNGASPHHHPVTEFASRPIVK